VAAVFNRQARIFKVLGMAVANRRHIYGHTISENAHWRKDSAQLLNI
jgi:hypothetical protein